MRDSVLVTAPSLSTPDRTAQQARHLQLAAPDEDQLQRKQGPAPVVQTVRSSQEHQLYFGTDTTPSNPHHIQAQCSSQACSYGVFPSALPCKNIARCACKSRTTCY